MEEFFKKPSKKPRHYIFRASFTTKDGVKHYARDYGKRAFIIPVY